MRIVIVEFQENPMLLVLRQGYPLGTRSIGFFLNRIMQNSIKKQNCPCLRMFFNSQHIENVLEPMAKFIQTNPSTDRQIVHFWQFLVPWNAPWNKFYVEAGTFYTCWLLKNMCNFAFFVQSMDIRHRENATCLMPPGKQYEPGTRHIAFPWCGLISIDCVKKQNTCLLNWWLLSKILPLDNYKNARVHKIVHILVPLQNWNIPKCNLYFTVLKMEMIWSQLLSGILFYDKIVLSFKLL